MKKFTAINFSPFATNVLDWCGKPGLVTRDGLQVSIYRSMGGFVVIIGDSRYETPENVHASFLLNRAEVGTME